LKGVPFRFTGLQSLRIKETDRISALITELRKLGFVLKAEGDEALLWDGERCIEEDNPVISTYEDHRMAMAFAPASFLYNNLQIANPEVVSKSYPHFWEDLKTAGFTVY
jgi:3-phosphoshikimate 1-carboxyvinyltransferase